MHLENFKNAIVCEIHCFWINPSATRSRVDSETVSFTYDYIWCIFYFIPLLILILVTRDEKPPNWFSEDFWDPVFNRPIHIFVVSFQFHFNFFNKKLKICWILGSSFNWGIWILENIFQFFTGFRKIEIKLNCIWKTLIQISI